MTIREAINEAIKEQQPFPVEAAELMVSTGILLTMNAETILAQAGATDPGHTPAIELLGVMLGNSDPRQRDQLFMHLQRFIPWWLNQEADTAGLWCMPGGLLCLWNKWVETEGHI